MDSCYDAGEVLTKKILRASVSFISFSFQELRRNLSVRQTDQWSVQNRS